MMRNSVLAELRVRRFADIQEEICCMVGQNKLSLPIVVKANAVFFEQALGKIQ